MKTIQIFQSIGFFIFFILGINPLLRPQVLEVNKTVELPGGAKIGEIANISVNETTGELTVSFVTNQKSGKLFIENYFFDNDYNIINNQKEELDKQEAAQKYLWLGYSGETIESLTLDVKEDDKLLIKRKRNISKYNWKRLCYYAQDVQLLEKVKLKSPEAENYHHYRNWWSEEDPDFIYVLCSVPDKNDNSIEGTVFHLLKINMNIEVVKTIEIKFDYPQFLIYPSYLDKDSDLQSVEIHNDIICVFAPMNSGKKYSNPNTHDYSFLRINSDLEIIDRITFNSPSDFWSLEDYVYDQSSDSYYMFGASLDGRNEYYDNLTGTKKFNGFQVMKITNHKLDYLTHTGIDEFTKKQVMPPSEKKLDVYDGKRFNVWGYASTPNGKLVIAGQNFFKNTMNAISGDKEIINISYYDEKNDKTFSLKGKNLQFSDCFAFGYDETGKLIGQYTLNVKGFMGGQSFPLVHHFFNGKNPDNIYWLNLQTIFSKLNIWGGYGPSWYDFLSSGFGKIDLKNNTMTDFINYQTLEEKKASTIFFYKNPFIELPNNKLLLFGSQSWSKGKKLWFARLRLD